MKWRAAALTAIRPWSRLAWPRITRLPSSYDGEKPGVGVERGDVHAVRLAQQEERQERHERLVEVEEVELLARRAGRGPG